MDTSPQPNNFILLIVCYHKIYINYIIEKGINGGWKSYFGLENNCKSSNLVMWDKKKLWFETLVIQVIIYGCEVCHCSISRDSWRKIGQIHKYFITCNIKIKSNIPYPILLIKVALSLIESITMTRYLM